MPNKKLPVGTPKKLRVAVICGGPSSEHDVSMRSGKNIYKSLDRTRFIPTFIEITRNGVWKVKKTEIPKRTKGANLVVGSKGKRGSSGSLKDYADVVFIGLHGKFGEDGRVQALLEMEGIPYTGSGVLASALAMDKNRTISFLKGFNIKAPQTIAITKTQSAQANKKNLLKLPFAFPCVVKPNASGSSIGVTIVRSAAALERSLQEAFKEDNVVLVEEYVKGRELTCGVMGNATLGEPATALPPVEIISDRTFFDYHAKYHSAKTREICPAPISAALTKRIQMLAARVHEFLGCDGLTRSDFILGKNGLIFLEINTLPGMTEQSLCPKEAAAMGMPLTDFFSALIDLALWKNRA